MFEGPRARNVALVPCAGSWLQSGLRCVGGSGKDTKLPVVEGISVLAYEIGQAGVVPQRELFVVVELAPMFGPVSIVTQAVVVMQLVGRPGRFVQVRLQGDFRFPCSDPSLRRASVLSSSRP